MNRKINPDAPIPFCETTHVVLPFARGEQRMRLIASASNPTATNLVAEIVAMVKRTLGWSPLFSEMRVEDHTPGKRLGTLKMEWTPNEKLFCEMAPLLEKALAGIGEMPKCQAHSAATRSLPR